MKKLSRWTEISLEVQNAMTGGAISLWHEVCQSNHEDDKAVIAMNRVHDRLKEVERCRKLTDKELQDIINNSDNVICFRTASAEINRRRNAA